jgi:hypothetical protein
MVQSFSHAPARPCRRGAPLRGDVDGVDFRCTDTRRAAPPKPQSAAVVLGGTSWQLVKFEGSDGKTPCFGRSDETRSPSLPTAR